MDYIIPFYTPAEKVLVKSEGCYQYDSEGNKYIDFESGVWCANIGHNNPDIACLIADMTKESIHQGYRFTNIYAEKLSKELLYLTGLNEGASVFLSSGSEAVNLAITLVRHITGRKKILKIDNSYLSAYGWGQISPDNDTIVDVPFNNKESLNGIDFSDVAAFILETGGASIDVVQFPDYEFVRKIVRLCNENDCPVIAEEITTGMGRTGKWFGFQHYDITPDIVVTGKGLGNGYPVSAVTINNKMNRLFIANPFRYAQSHQNDPLGCAVGMEVVNILKRDKLTEVAYTTGLYFKNKMEQIQNKYPDKVKEVRARGLMLALELDKVVDGEFINKELFYKGFITGYKKNNFRFMPPLIIKNYDIDKLTQTLDSLLALNINN